MTREDKIARVVEMMCKRPGEDVSYLEVMRMFEFGIDREEAEDISAKAGDRLDKIQYKVEYTTPKPGRNWRLKEVSDDGKLVGSDDLFPWPYYAWFRANEVRYFIHHGTDTYDEERKTYNIETEETIVAELVPEKKGGYGRPPNYSIMGFHRAVKEITLQIRRAGDNSSSTCYAAPQFDYGEFGTETYPDFIQFKVSLEEEKFDAIVQLIKSGSLQKLTWSVNNVDGFYSNDGHWQTTTDLIKILPQLSEDGECSVGLDLPDGLGHKVPRTGNVSEYSLQVATNAISDEPEEDENDGEDLVEDPIVTALRESHNNQMEALNGIAGRLQDIQLSAASILICSAIGFALLVLLLLVLVC